MKQTNLDVSTLRISTLEHRFLFQPGYSHQDLTCIVDLLYKSIWLQDNRPLKSFEYTQSTQILFISDRPYHVVKDIQDSMYQHQLNQLSKIRNINMQNILLKSNTVGQIQRKTSYTHEEVTVILELLYKAISSNLMENPPDLESIHNKIFASFTLDRDQEFKPIQTMYPKWFSARQSYLDSLTSGGIK